MFIDDDIPAEQVSTPPSSRSLPLPSTPQSLGAMIIFRYLFLFTFQVTPSGDSPRKPLSWDIAHADFVEKEAVGKGAIGDYIRTIWKGREVVQKVLLNQQIAEDDMLGLKARASILV